MNHNANTTLAGAGRLGGPLLVLAILALWIYTRTEPPQRPADHDHPPGAHGGMIVPLAGDRFHAEALIEQGGLLRLYLLGADATLVLDVDEQPLVAYVTADDYEAHAVPVKPAPQPGDSAGRTSQFVGQLPLELQRRPLGVTIPNLRIGRQRFRLGFVWSDAAHDAMMPAKLTDEAERELYLTPAGRYTADDIAANGRSLPSEKFRGFRARHDFNPQPGDRLCPVSRTKANPECVWIVDGHRYELCCPPCIDELVLLAKQQPDKLLAPEAYVAGNSAGGEICTGSVQNTLQP